MKILLNIFSLLLITSSLYAQEVPFDDVLEAASGNATSLKITLIESGWSHNKYENDETEEEIYYYSYSLFGIELSAIYIEEETVLIAQVARGSLYKTIYEELKSNCNLEGVNTFPEKNVDFIEYTCSNDITFAVFTTDGTHYILGGKMLFPY